MFKNLSPETLGISGQQNEVIELALSFGFKGIDLNAVEFAARNRQVAWYRRASRQNNRVKVRK